MDGAERQLQAWGGKGLFLAPEGVVAQLWVVGCVGGFTEGLLVGPGGR